MGSEPRVVLDQVPVVGVFVAARDLDEVGLDEHAYEDDRREAGIEHMTLADRWTDRFGERVELLETQSRRSEGTSFEVATTRTTGWSSIDSVAAIDLLARERTDPHVVFHPLAR